MDILRIKTFLVKRIASSVLIALGEAMRFWRVVDVGAKTTKNYREWGVENSLNIEHMICVRLSSISV